MNNINKEIQVSNNFLNGIYGSIENDKTNKWTLNETKTYLSIIKSMQENNSLELLLHPSDFNKNLTDKNNFKYFNGILKGIKRKDFYMKIDEDKYRNYSLFSFLEYDTRGEAIKVKFNSDLRKEILSIKTFKNIKLETILNFNSLYSLRTTLLLSTMNHLNTYVIEIKRFRTLFQIPKNYKNNMIVSRVFDVILKECLEVKSINFKYSGRKATHVIFNYDFLNKRALENKNNNIPEAEIVGGDLGTNPNILKAVSDAKKNIYVSKAWDKRADNRIQELITSNGEDFVIRVLKGVYKKLKMDVKTSLVQYINGVVKNIKLEDESVKEKEIKKAQSKSLQGVELKETKKEGLKIDTVEPKNKDYLNTDLESPEIKKAMEKCCAAEGVEINFLEGLKKRSKSIFMTTIKKYI